MAKRKFKLTWQKGTGSRPGRWRKVIYGSVYYFDGGNGKSDQVAYKAAVAEYEKLKSELSATQNPHRAEYLRSIVILSRSPLGPRITNSFRSKQTSLILNL